MASRQWPAGPKANARARFPYFFLTGHWPLATGHYLTYFFTGAAAGAEAAGRVGELVASHIIARPHSDLLTGFGAGGGGSSL